MLVVRRALARYEALHILPVLYSVSSDVMDRAGHWLAPGMSPNGALNGAGQRPGRVAVRQRGPSWKRL